MTASLIILLLIILVLLIIGIVGLMIAFWIWMLVDAIKRELTDGEKIAWVLVIVFLSWLGAIIYYFAVKRPDKKIKKR